MSDAEWSHFEKTIRAHLPPILSKGAYKFSLVDEAKVASDEKQSARDADGTSAQPDVVTATQPATATSPLNQSSWMQNLSNSVKVNEEGVKTFPSSSAAGESPIVSHPSKKQSPIPHGSEIVDVDHLPEVFHF